MAIQSHAFGRVKLTGEDARKFANQVTHGRPKAAAVESVKRGVVLSQEFQQTGKVKLRANPSR